MRSKSVPPVVWAALAVPVLWTAVLAAGVYESGMNLFQLLERLSAAAHLFSVRWTAYTPRFVLVFLMLLSLIHIFQMRINPEIKREAEDVFSAYGLSLTDAFNIFLQQSLNSKMCIRDRA